MKAPQVLLEREELRVVRPPATMGEKPEESKWGGLYLRAPDVFYRVLERVGDKLVPLREIAEVRRGFTTGANGFFYLKPLPYRPPCPLCGAVHEDALTAEEERGYHGRGEKPPAGQLVAVRNGMGWEGYLEAEALFPLLRSPRDLPWDRLEVWPQELSMRVFLPQRLGDHSQAYVDWGERARVGISQGRNRGEALEGVHRLPSVGGRSPWWKLPVPALPPNLVCMMSYHHRFGFWINQGALVDNRMYTIVPRPGIDILALAGALNTAFTFLQQGLLGRNNLGQGALDFSVYEAEALLVYDPRVERLPLPSAPYRVGDGWNDRGLPGLEDDLHQALEALHRERLERATSLEGKPLRGV